MSRAISVIIAVMTLSFLAGLWLPWWNMAIMAAVVCFLVPARSGSSLLCGFLAGALLWGGLAFKLDWANNQLLSTQIGEVFNGIPPIALILISALVGGLVSGSGALTGSTLRAIFQRKARK